jgi:hypothetical protein
VLRQRVVGIDVRDAAVADHPLHHARRRLLRQQAIDDLLREPLTL